MPDPPDRRRRIAMLGGVPPALGGGGLEVQRHRTADALRARGHEVLDLESAPAGTEWDVLHAFGSEGNVQFALEHWNRHPTPLVLSPVIVVSPGPAEIALTALSRVRVPATHASQRRAALRRANVLVAITEYERRVLRGLTGGRVPVEVVPNGIESVPPAAAGPVPPGAVLLLGAISARKRQHEVVRVLSGRRTVVVGGFSGSAAERTRWERALAASGACWLGEIRDPSAIARLQSDAAALVHLSRAEVQSLAVLETLSRGTPVILSDLPSHRELAARWPDWVRIASSPTDVPALLNRLEDHPPTRPGPSVPSWDDVAARLEPVYRRLIG